MPKPPKTYRARRNHHILPIAIILALTLVAGYVFLCTCVNQSQQILPNVYIGSYSVGTLSTAEAQRSLTSAMSDSSVHAELTLTHGDWSATYADDGLGDHDGTGILAATAVGRDSLPTMGYHYIRHLLGQSTAIPLSAPLSEGADAELRIILKQHQQELADRAMHSGWFLDSEIFTVQKGFPIAIIDIDATLDDVHSALLTHREGVLGRDATTDSASITVPIVFEDFTGEALDFTAIHDSIYIAPVDTVLDADGNTVTEGIVGMDFDVELAKAYYFATEMGGSFSIPLIFTHPKTIAPDPETPDTTPPVEPEIDLEDLPFPDMIAEMSNIVRGEQARKDNVARAAAACNNTIILPGEQFSFQSIIGNTEYLAVADDPDDANSVILGGGISQMSSTLCHVLHHTTVDITEQHLHPSPVDYIPNVMDAKTDFGALDLRFVNTYDTALKITSRTYLLNGNTHLYIKIDGTRPDQYFIWPRGNQLSTFTPEPIYRPDATVPLGTTITAQTALDGGDYSISKNFCLSDGTYSHAETLSPYQYTGRPAIVLYHPDDGVPVT